MVLVIVVAVDGEVVQLAVVESMIMEVVGAI